MSKQSLKLYRLMVVLLLCSSVLSFLLPIPTAKATASETYGLELVDDEILLQPTTYPAALYIPQVNCTFFMYMKGKAITPPANYEFYAKVFNHTTETMGNEVHIGTSAGTDRHFAPSMGYLPNGSLIYFYDTHSQVPGYITYRVSKVAYSIATWNTAQTFSGDFTYPNPVCFTDKLVLFIRNSTFSGGQGVEWLRYDFTSSTFWANRTQIVDDYSGGGWYCTWHREGDKIVVGGHLWNGTATKCYNIYYAESYDKGVSWKTAGGLALSLPLGENAKILDVGWVSGYVYYPFVVYHEDNLPQVFVTRATTDAQETYHWLGIAYYKGGTWTYANIRNGNNQILNQTREGGTQMVYPFRDGSFNITTFWYLTLGAASTRRIARYMQSHDDPSVFVLTLTTTTYAYQGLFEAVANHLPPYEAFLNVAESNPDNYETGWLAYNRASYLFTFKGKYDEASGTIYPHSTRAVNVTAYFSDGTSSEAFECNGTYWYGSSSKPLYFSMNTTTVRQYWVDSTDLEVTIYIFDSSLTSYTIQFLDLAGLLPTYPFVEAKQYINGSLVTVEKRKVDSSNKVLMNLRNGAKYSLVLGDAGSYTFGDLQTTAITTITLTLRGIDFPKETLFTYNYVRIWGLREWVVPSITIVYQDLLNMTTSVHIDLCFKNGTVNTDTTINADGFTYAFLGISNQTDYIIKATITHERYGTYQWNQYFNREYSTNPWVLGWLGTLPFDVNNLVGIVIVIFVGGGFSIINPEVGAFFATCSAAALTMMGWLPLAPGTLLAAFCFSIMLGLVVAKRRVQYF